MIDRPVGEVASCVSSKDASLVRFQHPALIRAIGEVASRDLASVEAQVRFLHRASIRGHRPIGKTRLLQSRDPGSNPGGSIWRRMQSAK